MLMNQKAIRFYQWLQYNWLSSCFLFHCDNQAGHIKGKLELRVQCRGVCYACKLLLGRCFLLEEKQYFSFSKEETDKFSKVF